MVMFAPSSRRELVETPEAWSLGPPLQRRPMASMAIEGGEFADEPSRQSGVLRPCCEIHLNRIEPCEERSADSGAY